MMHSFQDNLKNCIHNISVYFLFPPFNKTILKRFLNKFLKLLLILLDIKIKLLEIKIKLLELKKILLEIVIILLEIEIILLEIVIILLEIVILLLEIFYNNYSKYLLFS